MPRKTDGEKIDELEKAGAAGAARLDGLTKDLFAVEKTLSETQQALADLKRQHEKEIALHQREIEAVGKVNSETAKSLQDLQRRHERELATHQREIEDFKRSKEDQKQEQDERNRRIWAFGPSVVSALIGAIVALLIASLFPRR